VVRPLSVTDKPAVFDNVMYRAMTDADGPKIAKAFYRSVFANQVITTDDIPYALDDAVAELRYSGVSPERWATFVHMGA
jgi:hypothetical protein